MDYYNENKRLQKTFATSLCFSKKDKVIYGYIEKL